MSERTAWPDVALDREFARVYKLINGTPAAVKALETSMEFFGQQMQELVHENEQLRKEIRGAEWSRSQVIGALGVLVAFLGVIGSVLVAVLS